MTVVESENFLTKFFRPRFFSDVHTVSFIGVNPKSVFTQEFVLLAVQCCIKRDQIYHLSKKLQVIITYSAGKSEPRIEDPQCYR